MTRPDNDKLTPVVAHVLIPLHERVWIDGHGTMMPFSTCHGEGEVDGEPVTTDVSLACTLEAGFRDRRFYISPRDFCDVVIDYVKTGNTGDRVARAIRAQVELLGDEVTPLRRAATGEALKASEVVAMIDRRDPEIESFLDDVAGAAVRLVLIRSKKEEG